jgi:SAM-dependent methyltransferase
VDVGCTPTTLPRTVRRIAHEASLRSRRHKLRLLLDRLEPDSRTTVVDVGVTDAAFGDAAGHGSDNFFEAHYPWPAQITAVGLADLPRFRAAFPAVRLVIADGRRLPFADGEFDIAVSNAVVEHVGDADDQRAFVHELCRVGRRVFVSTPNRWFPIEVHTLLPLVHWLPRARARAAFRALGRQEAESFRLLGPREFRALFPFPVDLVATGVNLVAVGPRPLRLTGLADIHGKGTPCGAAGETKPEH